MSRRAVQEYDPRGVVGNEREHAAGKYVDITRLSAWSANRLLVLASLLLHVLLVHGLKGTF